MDFGLPALFMFHTLLYGASFVFLGPVTLHLLQALRAFTRGSIWPQTYQHCDISSAGCLPQAWTWLSVGAKALGCSRTVRADT